MTASEAPAVVCTYPPRSYANGFAAMLREHGIPAAIVPSDHHVGEWDVLVAARDADCASAVIQELLAAV